MTFRAHNAPSSTAAITTDTAAQSEPSHRERVAARMLTWQNSPTNRGRKRLRGGRRGRLSAHAADVLDLSTAIADLTLARATLLRLDVLTKSGDLARMDHDATHACRAAQLEAYAKINLASRFVDEIVVRRCK